MDWDENELIERAAANKALLESQMGLFKIHLKYSDIADRILSKIVLTDEEKTQVNKILDNQDQFLKRVLNKYDDVDLIPSNN